MNWKITSRYAIVTALLPPTFLFAAFQVKSISPKPQSMAAILAPEITIEFEAPVDPARINSNSIMIFGRWTGVMRGAFRLDDDNRRVIFTPAKEFSAGEWITVAVSKRVKSATGNSSIRGHCRRDRPAPAPCFTIAISTAIST